ncbi:cardiolipin synthase [Enterococcus sp. PF1-24]|uniref:cardiolipin synthase n=1 Tax=unclassified Enterococcus TaxID=2608891 RepID=UPI002474A8D0|nr:MULTISPECIES: cardiolipin synthase [unclassified Enterococcus]MDH6363958.1 cardiolipin synthase [Enterococcus sp. PFB1-1]MDH6401059.1 cardiolipin synthase [Enterococcus sp. PF1-24]
MRIFEITIIVILFINTVSAIITVFRKPRSIASVLAWLLTLTFLPGVGFILYAFCGRGLSKEKYLFRNTPEEQKDLKVVHKKIYADNQLVPDANISGEDLNIQALIHYFSNMDGSPLSKRNQVQLFTDGTEKFEALFEDIRQAKETVHVEYYAFFNDKIGNRFLDLLVERAQAGLEVRLVYDPWGANSKANWFKKLTDAGGEVQSFITARNLILETRLNYHLHRKIVVLDGKIGWTGGFNVGDQYLETTEKFGYWRDTHLRIEGTGALGLQQIFLMDWNASVQDPAKKLTYQEHFFPEPDVTLVGNTNLQVVSDGPDSSFDIIKGGFIRMILAAKKSVWIQTPYFIPDDSMVNALLIAAHSGIDVRIMIPCMPDHPFIYRATQYNANDFHRRGLKIYTYDKGFLHAKTMVIDGEICTVGSTNQDTRSYSLNFEDNVFIYDSKISEQLMELFLKDCKNSTLLTDEMIKNQSFWLRFKQNFSRLLSPIL